jgi:hypothetical protein
MLGQRSANSRAAWQSAQVKDVGIPAPVKGIVASSLYGSSNDQQPDTAIWLYNLVPGEYGVTVRQGSREWATNIEDSLGENGAVRTIMYYNSTVEGGTEDHSFAVTDAGIYDVSGGGAGPWDFSPVSALVWPNQGGLAGWCSYLNYTNINGDHFILVCDELNGFWIFDGSTWVQGAFTGNPAPLAVDLVQITEWQGRIWFVERNTATAWFLDPLALGGNITPMNVGTRFKKGGHLVQNSTWTMDDGDGMNDKFVQISSSGDVLVWDGVDPTVAGDLILKGRWFVGGVPDGRRVMSDWGGDTAILSTLGIVKVSSLLRGDNAMNSEAHISANITRLIRTEMEATLGKFGWGLESDPSQSIAIISAPRRDTSVQPIQFVINQVTKAWCMFRGLDMLCMDKSVTGFYFGTSDGRVMLSSGVSDDIALDGLSAKAIEYSFLSHYWHLNQPAIWKRPQFIRPSWLGTAQPSYSIGIEYDFAVNELPDPPPVQSTSDSEWDDSVWDINVWQGNAQRYFETVGVIGMGRHIAVAVRGKASSGLSYIGADLILDFGGNL